MALLSHNRTESLCEKWGLKKMTGITTSALITELIGKRPIKRKKRDRRSLKAPQNRNLKAVQKLLRVRGT